MDVHLEMIKHARKIADTSPLKEMIAKELNPSPAVKTDEQLKGKAQCQFCILLFKYECRVDQKHVQHDMAHSGVMLDDAKGQEWCRRSYVEGVRHEQLARCRLVYRASPLRGASAG